MREAHRAAARLAAELATREAAVAETRLQLAAAEAAVAEEDALVSDVLAPLPADLVRLVFLQLPADARLRSREVCRGWRAFLSDTFLWRVCDLSARSGVVARRTPALLHAASARAQGTLEVLNVTGWRGLFNILFAKEEYSRLTALLPVLHANADSLVELRAWECFKPARVYHLYVEDIEALLSAAPRLRLLECDAGGEGEDPVTTLRLLEEPQFAPVRLQALVLDGEEVGGLLDVPAAAAKISLHTSLMRLTLYDVALDNEPALDAFANLAVSQLQHLTLGGCKLLPASLPALTHMLGSGSRLKELCIWNKSAPLLSGASVPAFCAALRASRLVELTLEDVDLWGSLEDGLAVIAASTGHPTLRKLELHVNDLEDSPSRAAIVAALDGLEASNAELRLDR